MNSKVAQPEGWLLLPEGALPYWVHQGGASLRYAEDLLTLRFVNLKMYFMVQHTTGFDVWRTPYEFPRLPLLHDLRSDPAARSREHMGYDNWFYRQAFYGYPVTEAVGSFLASFQQFPPRRKAVSFTTGDAVEMITKVYGH